MKTSRLISGTTLILLMALAGTAVPMQLFASTGTETGYERSQSDIRQFWESLKPAYSGNPYVLQPAVKMPFFPGVLSGKFVEDGLRATNFMRYLVRLPPAVTTDRELMERAQHGAVLLSATDEFSHELPKPPTMSEEFYRKALQCTTTSNIARGFSTLEEAVQNGFARDDDEYNLRTLGHRRWILNPRFARTGFGFAEGAHYGMTRQLGNSTMQVHDVSGPEVDYEYIAWPSPGYFPREFYDADDPWSITLNPDRYQNPDLRLVKVVLVRVRDGKSWTLNKADTELNSDGEFFNVNLERYGVANVIIFRPVPAQIAEGELLSGAGDLMVEPTEFRVEITGLKRADGLRAAITYAVTFFDLDSGKTRPQSAPREIASQR